MSAMSVDEVWLLQLREACRQYHEGEITTDQFRYRLADLGYRSYAIEAEINFLKQTRKSAYIC